MPAGEERSRRELFLGALFFSELLLIHPFSDDNGRTARLLTAHLLRSTSSVPLSMHYRSRQLYLDVVEERTVNKTAVRPL